MLGQPDLNACAPTAASAATLSLPSAVWTDGQRLVVADTGNNRALVWKTFPTTSGQAADYVLGQPDATTSAPGTTPLTFSAPTDVLCNEAIFLLADGGNQRVLIWQTFPPDGATPPDVVLGQPDFTTAGAHAAATGFAQPTNLLLIGQYLLVSDRPNNRVMVFTPR